MVNVRAKLYVVPVNNPNAVPQLAATSQVQTLMLPPPPPDPGEGESEPERNALSLSIVPSYRDRNRSGIWKGFWQD
jgi:hypothetical protein